MPSSDTGLTSEEFNKCGEAFNEFVLAEGFGKIDSLWKLRNVLQALGQCPTDEEMEQYLPEKGKAYLEFDEFIKIVELMKSKFDEPPPADADAIEAFVAMGGEVSADGLPGGEVHTDHLRNLVTSFDLRLDIEKLIAEVDKDSSGEIDYGEFSQMFRNMTGSTGLIRAGQSFALSASHRRLPQAAGDAARRVRTSGNNSFRRRDSDLTSDGSDGGHRAMKNLALLTTERKPLALVIASGAKKTSEKREMTRDEMVAIRLRRVEANIKRLGLVGGEVPPVTFPVPLPAKVKRHLATIRSASSPEKSKAPTPGGKAAAGDTDDKAKVGWVYPGRRGRARISLSQRLPTTGVTPPGSLPSSPHSDFFGNTMASGVVPPDQHFQHRPEGVSTSLQAQVRGIQRQLKRQRESVSPRRGGTPTSLSLTHSRPCTPVLEDRTATNNFAINTLRNAMSFDTKKGVLAQPLLDSIPNSSERMVQFLTSAPPSQPNRLVRKLCETDTIASPITRSSLAAATTTIYKKSAYGRLAQAKSPFAKSLHLTA